MSQVVALPVGERSNPDAVLEEARNARLKKVVVLGWTDDGQFFFHGSESIASTIFLMRNAEYELFKTMDGMEDE